MTGQKKIKLVELLRDGNIQNTIDALLAVKRSKSLDKEIIAIASRYSRLKQKDKAGILTLEQRDIIENQIVDHLISVINHPDHKPYPVKNSISKSHLNKPVIWKYIVSATIAIGILFSLAEVLSFIDIIPSRDPLQLTVFVTDEDGNVAVELEGEINIVLGNRSLNKVIGEDGRTNFADITPDNKGDTIKIGLKAWGWEIVDKNTFVFTGKPITLKIKKDSDLGFLKGRIISRDKQKFIEGAMIAVRDTFVYTDTSGFFKIQLPETMWIKRATETYFLTISKDGYKVAEKCYSPKSLFEEIAIEKLVSSVSPEAQLRRLRQELKNLEDLWDSGDIDASRYIKSKSDLQVKINELEQQNQKAY